MIVPMDEITELGNADFFRYFAEGKLNSLQLPAHEYLDRQDIIREEVRRRTFETEQGLLETYFQVVPVIESQKEFFRPHLIIYIREEGMQAEFQVCTSYEDAITRIERFEKTGLLRFYDFAKNMEIDMAPTMVGYVEVKDIFRVTGQKDIEKVPKQ